MGNTLPASTSPRVPPRLSGFALTAGAPSAARLEGALLGMAIGDFVGAFVEGNAPAESAAAVDRIASCVREQVRCSLRFSFREWNQLSSGCSKYGPVVAT